MSEGDPGTTPLSHRQRLIWLGQRLDPDVPLYNMVRTFRFGSGLDVEAFRTAHARLIEGCDALRLVIEDNNGEPRQRAVEPGPGGPGLVEVDLSGEADPDESLARWVEAEAGRPFDLAKSLFTSALVTVADDRHVWFINQHHLIADAWSASLILKRQGELYGLAVEGRIDAADPMPSFLEATAAEQARAADPDGRWATAAAAAEAHWADRLADPIDPLTFYGPPGSGLGPGPRNDGTTSIRQEAELGPQRTARIEAFLGRPDVAALSSDLTMLKVVNTVLFATLHRAGGNRRIAVGTPFHGRATRAAKRTIGPFMNLYPVVADVEPDETMGTLADKLGRELFEGMTHAGHPPKERSDQPLYEVVCNYIHATFDTFGPTDSSSTSTDDGLEVTTDWHHNGAGDRGHSLRVQVLAGRKLRLLFDCKADRFDAAGRQALIDDFLAVFDQWMDAAERGIDPLVADLDLLTGQQRQELLVDFNDQTDGQADPPNQTVVARFRAVVADRPDAPACSWSGRSMTYRELADEVDAVASRLDGRGVGPGDLVILLQRRSPTALASMLATNALGAAWIPLDATTPAARVDELVREAQPALILGDADLVDALADDGGRIGSTGLESVGLAIDEPSGGRVTNLDQDPDPDLVDVDRSRPQDTAYVIFTSGSTGRPKGVPISHSGLTNYAHWALGQYCDHEPRRFALFTSLAFDLTITSIFVPLISGGEVLIHGESAADGDGLPPVLSAWNDDRAEVVKLTPSHLAAVGRAGSGPRDLQTLIVGGEDFVTDLAAEVQRTVGPQVAIYNEYGPTETVVGCMIHRYDLTRDRRRSVPIGRPAANATIHLLDVNGRPVRPGVVGEIHIGGPGVSSGYLNQPELTAERFVEPHPSLGSSAGPGRLYRSGDLGRWRLDSEAPELEFLGRADDQVKVRGHRIELGEVEAALMAVGGVETATAVVVKGDVTDHRDKAPATVEHCSRCGLPSSYPMASFRNGVCSLCRDFDTYREKVDDYFGTPAELEAIAADIAAQRSNDAAYDCLVLLSGGKDSTYMLYQVAALGLRPLVFTLDNGFISDEAKANCRRVTDDLGFDLVMGTTPHMNEIFRDSLDRFSNVCNGCFKTIYTLSVNLAIEHGITHIITGLARGQLFETRLSDMYDKAIFDVDRIDSFIIEARKVYHRLDDAVSRLLDVSAFAEDELFDQITFVDFYRYVDVGLDEVMTFLGDRTPWTRPADTGRSTNCLINDVGIHVHQVEQGFHNYAFPYSWDVRLGHKNRQAAMDELDDDIDEDWVGEVLVEIGYKPKPPRLQAAEPDRLVGYVVVDSGGSQSEWESGSESVAVDEAGLRSELARSVPAHLVPDRIVVLDELPLTVNGKVDRKALPPPSTVAAATNGSEAETTETTPLSGEVTAVADGLRAAWAEIFGRTDIGLYENFFDLGGDSIIGIQIVARAAESGITFAPRLLFEHQTIAELATTLAARSPAAASDPIADQGPVTGTGPLTPIQARFLATGHDDPDHWNQVVHLKAPADLDTDKLRLALNSVIEHHDALRSRFDQEPNGLPTQRFGATHAGDPLAVIDLSTTAPGHAEATRETALQALNESFDLAQGPLIGGLVVLGGADGIEVHLAANHLVVDGVSWYPILSDLEAAYQALSSGRQPALPPKTTSYQRWGDVLNQADQLLRPEASESEPTQPTTDDQPSDRPSADSALARTGTRHLWGELDVAATEQLLRQANSAYRTEITELLVAALTRIDGPWRHGSSAEIEVETHGRDLLDRLGDDVEDAATRAALKELADTVDLTRTVGWFTAMARLTLPVADQLADHVPATKEAYRSLLPAASRADLLGAGHGISDAPAVLFNYLGQLDQITGGAELFVMEHRMDQSIGGRNLQEHSLELAMMVTDDRLRVRLTHHLDLMTEAEAQGLLQAYLTELGTIIDHCLDPTAGTVTPSDFALADLNQDELDRLGSLLDG